MMLSKTKQDQQLHPVWALPYNNTMKINVTHVAKLANLPLTDDEKKRLEPQLSEVLTYVDKLQKGDTSGVEPTSQVTGLENILREDKSGKSLPQELAISQAPSSQKGMFQPKGIFEE